MGLGFGIDFGTTNSTVCIYDGQEFLTVYLENEQITMPSLLYVDREFRPFFGEAARTRFLADNEGRRIQLEKYEVGTIEIVLGDNAFESMDHTGFDPAPTSYDASVTGVTDLNLPGFLFAGSKRLLGQTVFESVQLFGRRFRLVAVVSSLLKHLLSRTTGQVPQVENASIRVGRPVNYECPGTDGQEGCNDRAIDRMREALSYAGLKSAEFFLEPIAPVLAWMAGGSVGDRVSPVADPQPRAGRGENVLVLDFGGGTLDFSLVRIAANRIEVRDNDGYALGGDIITEMLIRDHVFPLIGFDEETLAEVRPHNLEVDELVPLILNWRTTYMLNQPEYLNRLREAMRVLPSAAHRFNRARLLIVRNYSYHLFHAVDLAKQRLTTEAVAEVRLPAVDIELSLMREEMESSLATYLSSVTTKISAFCRSDGAGPDQVDSVILTGGTSLIPAIQESIQELFPRRVVPIDPFQSIVKGFAIAARLGADGRLSQDGDRLIIDLE